ncbi:MAG: hypothetical protein IJA10_03210 [Lachnospiraceae bacterium]|nr:hypothetical protein [Lachnospiraceae bacterium]
MCITNDDPFDYQVLNLTTKFYNNYPDPPYKEIIRKDARPYNCLLIQSHYDYFICIPYRSHVNHKYSYRFKYSTRSRRTYSGLDYTKIVIIKNLEYISISDAVIDADEYKETRDNIDLIKKDSQTYIDDYIKHILKKSAKYDVKKFQRVYGFSTLQYFHRELEI